MYRQIMILMPFFIFYNLNRENNTLRNTVSQKSRNEVAATLRTNRVFGHNHAITKLTKLENLIK